MRSAYLGPPWACPWVNESRQLNQFATKQMETPTGLPHDTRMPVNESPGCGVVSASHTYWCLRELRVLACETCAPTSKLVGAFPEERRHSAKQYFVLPISDFRIRLSRNHIRPFRCRVGHRLVDRYPTVCHATGTQGHTFSVAGRVSHWYPPIWQRFFGSE